MKIKKAKGANDFYLVESSTKGNYWNVDLGKRTCNCPSFLFRQRAHGEVCKHISAVEEMLHKVKTESKDDFEKVAELVKKKGAVDSIELIEEFGVGLINDMIERGELIEHNGKIKIVE